MSSLKSVNSSSAKDPQPVESFWKQKKQRLLSHSTILEDLKIFTCKCRPAYCLGVEDAAFVGHVRSTVAKFSTQTEVGPFIHVQAKSLLTLQEQQWRFEIFQSGNIADKSLTALQKRVVYQDRTLCLVGFSVMVAGHCSSYRKKSVTATVQQVELECQLSKDQQFVDQRELLQRAERRALLRSLTEIGQNDFLAASAYAFCVDHMDLLCCHDPVTGQKQLDATVMQSTFELYEVMCGGPDSVGTVSKTAFERILFKAKADFEFKVRENKTVSKCETCKPYHFI